MRATTLCATSLAALLALLVAAGCGGGGPSGPSTPNPPNTPNNPNNPNTPTPPSASATITMATSDDGYGSAVSTFVPAQVRLARNGTVTFANTSGVSHNVAFANVPGAPANIQNHVSGENARTFPTAGTFDFQCTNHGGMTGKITVVP